MARNRYNVPQKAWRKWSKTAQNVFNALYCAMMRDSSTYQHPKAERVPKKYWKTTAWNAAWIAACATDNL